MVCYVACVGCGLPVKVFPIASMSVEGVVPARPMVLTGREGNSCIDFVLSRALLGV